MAEPRARLSAFQPSAEGDSAMGCSHEHRVTRAATEEEIAELDEGVDEIYDLMNSLDLVQPTSLGTIFDAEISKVFEGPEFERRKQFFKDRGIYPGYVSETAWVFRRDDGKGLVRFAHEVVQSGDPEGTHTMRKCFHDGNEGHQAIGVEWVVCEWSEIAR